MTTQQRDHLAKLTAKAMGHAGPMETARGYLRYEALRRLNAWEFQDLYMESIKQRIPFDELVDELVFKHSNHSPCKV